MILESQRRLAAEILGVGKNKVLMDKNNLEDIKKAITRYDIRELIKGGTIKVRIKPKAKKKNKEKIKRSIGKTRKRIAKRKERYIHKIRKFRKYIQSLLDKKMISQDEKKKLRKMARAGEIRNMKHLQDYVQNIINKKIELKK